MRQPGQSRRQTAGISWAEGDDTGSGGEAPQAHPGRMCRAELPCGFGFNTTFNNEGVVPHFGEKGKMKKAKISKNETKSFFFFSLKRKKRWIFGLNSPADLALQSHKS